MLRGGVGTRGPESCYLHEDQAQDSHEDRHIIRNARVQPTASSAAIQAKVAPSLRAPASFELYEGTWPKDIWGRGSHYVCCSRRRPIDASVWSGATQKETGLQRNGTMLSLAM
ncbi:hypothetical protein TNCV_284611 [Trichonephila clavipes]|uniref:Uncharacterized protein n=1 Tax=Trichonephila clavipes TaxID=2585209 RepID=A0A8X6SJ24_TRICX|nr:hypothetical protein TNCV_284611 [Trichonephila clavipes]